MKSTDPLYSKFLNKKVKCVQYTYSFLVVGMEEVGKSSNASTLDNELALALVVHKEKRKSNPNSALKCFAAISLLSGLLGCFIFDKGVSVS